MLLRCHIKTVCHNVLSSKFWDLGVGIRWAGKSAAQMEANMGSLNRGGGAVTWN